MSPQACVVDLGCGDGRLLQACHDVYSCQCWGAELDGAAIAACPFAHVADMFTCDIQHADVVIMYVGRQCTPKLAATLGDRLRPNTIVRSLRYHIPPTPGLYPVGATGPRWARVYDYQVSRREG